MNKNQAIHIAQNHILELNRTNPIPEIEYIIPEPTEYPNFWYFDHKFEVIKPTDEPVMMAGAPGFRVEKLTGECETSSWEEYHKMRKDGSI